MSGNKAALFLAVLLLFTSCSKSEKPLPKPQAIIHEQVSKVDPRAFAAPGEDAPISDLALDPASHYLAAMSRKGRKIGATQIPTGAWAWRNKLSQSPVLLAVHPLTGEGFLLWEGERGGGVATFRVNTGEPIASAELPSLPRGPIVAHALDEEHNHLYFAVPEGLACLDLRTRQLVPARPGEPVARFVGALDLAVDARRSLAVVPHAGGGVTLIDLTLWGQYGARAATEVQLERQGERLPAAVAVDSDQSRAFVLHGREWVEIDIETRQVDRKVAFDPEHEFVTGRMALAMPCRRMYLASGELVEVDLETGKWESIGSLGERTSPLLYTPSLGALFAIQNGQIYSSYQRCVP